MEQIKITKEEIKELIPQRVSLYYVDYQDSLDDHHEIIQRCVSEGKLTSLYENIGEWFQDGSYESENYYKDELVKDIARKYDIDEDEAEELLDEYDDFIRETLHDRDASTPLSDLLRNTQDFIAHYDTGYEVESGSWSWTDAEIRLERYKIKKFLGVNHSDLDKDIDMMIRQASYGGNLLIFFNLDINEFTDQSFEPKSIRFRNYHIGIIDHCNGSGDVMHMSMEEVTLPFNRDNVWLEESIKYNWTYAISGMCSDWCDSTDVTLLAEEVEGEIETSSTVALQKREAEYNATFKAGSCTAGDMDINRHRNVNYINNFPCGNKCTDCGTFWID